MVDSGDSASASCTRLLMSISILRKASSEPSVSGFESRLALARSFSANMPVLQMTIPPGLRSLMLTTSAAGFIATSTSGASPGVWMSFDAKRIWKPETPGRVPAGARISAGKSGKVARSLPTTALVCVNWLPVICMPSPESPAKRITTFSCCWRGSSAPGCSVVAMGVGAVEKADPARIGPDSGVLEGLQGPWKGRGDHPTVGLYGSSSRTLSRTCAASFAKKRSTGFLWAPGSHNGPGPARASCSTGTAPAPGAPHAAMHTRFASSLSTSEDPERAFDECVEALQRDLGGPPDLVCFFVSHHHGPALEELGERLRRATGARVLLGCTGESIVGEAREVERGPALSLWAGVLPGTSLTPFSVGASQDPDGAIVFSRLPEVRDRARASLLLLGDPFTFPMAAYLRFLNERLTGVPAVGGMASGGSGPGQNLLFLDGDVHAAGAVGVLLEGATEILSVVSQGCRPVGEPHVVTACEGQRITRLGGKPATEVLLATLRGLSDESERRQLQTQPFMGLAVDARKSTFERGDFLVRGIVGFDTHQSAVIVSDETVRRGMSVQFLVRDAASADDDLAQLLRERGQSAASDEHGTVGALVFSCNGRGSRMFDVPDHDITCVQSAFPARLPAAGFFAMGEIGPVGGQNFLHGFTASVALFRERD